MNTSMMKANMKELDLNEMEQVNGGCVITIAMIAACLLAIGGGVVIREELKD